MTETAEAADGGRKLTVLVVDDHELIQWGFRVLLSREPWVERVLGAGDAATALTLARRFRPDVAVVDLFLGTDSGAELSEAIRAAVPTSAVLLVSGAGQISPHDARAVGASGFVSKQWGAADVAGAVRMVGLGMTVFPPTSGQPPRLLSEREQKVLSMMAAGATNQEIADALFLSPHTVKDYATALYKKMKVRNRAEAVVRAQRMGLLD